jgi:hypothetical protein
VDQRRGDHTPTKDGPGDDRDEGEANDRVTQRLRELGLHVPNDIAQPSGEVPGVRTRLRRRPQRRIDAKADGEPHRQQCAAREHEPDREHQDRSCRPPTVQHLRAHGPRKKHENTQRNRSRDEQRRRVPNRVELIHDALLGAAGPLGELADRVEASPLVEPLLQRALGCADVIGDERRKRRDQRVAIVARRDLGLDDCAQVGVEAISELVDQHGDDICVCERLYRCR